MAIHILYGPGGTGKSYYQMRLICDELKWTKRNICTNLAIDLGRLCSFVEETYPEVSIDVMGRVRLLTDSETQCFWKHRGPLKWKQTDVNPLNGYTDMETEFDQGLLGCLFIIDEAGVAGFSATGWAATEGRSTRGQDCSWYLDQQRKFGDDVYASCNGRRPSGIAKPFRDKAHFFIRLKNGYLQTYGIFKGRGRFTAEHYTQEPDASAEAMKVEAWQMDAKGIGSCYRTQDGVGVRGQTADIGKRAKGIPILWAIPMFVVAGLVVAVGLPMFLGQGVAKYAAKHVEGGAKAVDTATIDGKGLQVPTESTKFAGDASTRPQQGVVAPSAVTVRGYVMFGKKVNVTLSDGRMLTETDRELQAIDRSGVTVAGTKLFYSRPVDRPLPVVSKQVEDSARSAASGPRSEGTVFAGEQIGPPPGDITKREPSTMPSGMSAAKGRASTR